MTRTSVRERTILDGTKNLRFILGWAEAAGDEQEQGDYRVESQEVKRHQHRYDETAAAAVHQDRDLEDGRYHHEQRGHRGENTFIFFAHLRASLK